MKAIYQILHLFTKKCCKCVEVHGQYLTCKRCGQIVGVVYPEHYGEPNNKILLFPQFRDHQGSLPKHIVEKYT